MSIDFVNIIYMFFRGEVQKHKQEKTKVLLSVFFVPLLYLLYHKFPDLSIVFSKKNKNFFTFSGLIAGLPFLALVSKNCLNYQNLVNFGGARPCAAKKKKRLPALPFFLIYSVYTFLAFILSVLVSVYVNVSGSNAFSITSISRSK